MKDPTFRANGEMRCVKIKKKQYILIYFDRFWYVVGGRQWKAWEGIIMPARGGPTSATPYGWGSKYMNFREAKAFGLEEGFVGTRFFASSLAKLKERIEQAVTQEMLDALSADDGDDEDPPF